jgi:hypothetical protein
MADMLGPIIIIAIVAIIYLLFNKIDTDKGNKDAQIHVKRTMATVELEKVKAQQEDLKLKQEILRYRREENKAIPLGSESNSPRGIEVEYKVVDQLEDKRRKT